TDRQRRHTEYAARDGVVRFAAQRSLDARIGNAGGGVRDAQTIDELRPFDRQIRQPAVTPDEAEDLRDRLDPVVACDREPQQRQWIERMRVRKSERNAERFRLPDDEAIRKAALRGDFRRSPLAVRAENR